MKIVFLGTPDFAVVSLKAILASRHEVVAVVTPPDKPKGRGLKLQPSAVKKAALEAGLPVYQPERLKDDSFIKQLQALRADVFVVVAFKILPREIFTIPPFGTVNLHASLLPRYRGAAPINWAIINGDTETGVTTMLIDEKVDTGQILLQESTPIGPGMTAGELHDILAQQGAELLVKTLDLLEAGKIEPKKQDDAQASRAPKLNKEMMKIRFNQPVQKVYNLIRGLSPYPGTFCYYEQLQMKIYRSTIKNEANEAGKPGQILTARKGQFLVACQPGVLQIEELQLQGKKRMPVDAFLNGFHVKEGACLT